MFSVEVHYYEHDGGTKFYELTLIKEDGGPALLLKRYGKMTYKLTGGQVLVERGSYSELRVDLQKTVSEKTRLRPGKGRYLPMPLSRLGLHRLHGRRDITAEDLASGLAGHFNAQVYEAIFTYFNLDGTQANVVIEERPAPAPVVEEQRSEVWGTW